METEAIQDKWPEFATYCWGCGKNNIEGLQIKSYWDGDECVCNWQPKEQYLAFPGFLNGGIIASLIDCHSINTACAAAYGSHGRETGTEPILAYLTGSLYVEYLRPTPVEKPVVLKAKVKEFKPKKIVVTSKLLSRGEECARGEVVAVKIEV